ncbi:hypothetical protein DACRYDRAFT_24793 [Dacryopinax primogenitus]|uniref:Macrofage activating glyco protein n=1 Tax=Dacryopinax primogenitus (strain DJM 731) TaxID=1858805 RepID=M5FQM3_DACPD|nr:uncharacterized protein DACRYDRAFT_24793 [Dacryopinax primogenitus]EJT97838.1 hypothetical protein DACRYDRAFT_24793 [Dacryopinax primogenitus]
MHTITLFYLFLLASTASVIAQYSATYLPSDAPPQSEDGQSGTNQCGGGSNQTSLCQNAYINGVDDFCLWAPPDTTYQGVPSSIGQTERIEVAWCMRSGYGTRLIPNGAITGAHFIQTPNYVQILGSGDMTKLNLPSGDDGGELDPHGADGLGNPIGGLVFGTSFGVLQQYHEWTNFMWYGGFCFRACVDGPDASVYCNHIYDTLGCGWNMPGNYSSGVFESCQADNTEPMGVYVNDGTTSTFFQGQPSTPDAHTPAPSSNCQFMATISNEAALPATATFLPSNASVSSVGTSSGASPSGSTNNGAAATTSGSASPSSAGHSGAARVLPSGDAGMLVFLTAAAGLLGAFVIL